MKKQYIISKAATFRYWVASYRDGILIQRDKVWSDDLDSYIAALERDGYERAYTAAVVQEAKAEYERVAARQLVGDN